MSGRKHHSREHLATLTVEHAETGEVEAWRVQTTRQPGGSYGVQFSTTFIAEQAKLAQGISSGPTLRVMLLLPTLLDYVQWRRLDQVKLGTTLGINQGTVSKALKELLRIGYVEKNGTGPTTEWRLSSNYGWKGSVDSYHQFQRSRSAEKTEGERPDARTPHNNYYANSTPARRDPSAELPLRSPLHTRGK